MMLSFVANTYYGERLDCSNNEILYSRHMKSNLVICYKMLTGYVNAATYSLVCSFPLREANCITGLSISTY